MSLEKNQISTNQMIILGLFTFIGDMALVYPALMVAGAKQDAWIAALISIPLGLATIKLLLCLADIEPNKNIIELSLQILGKWAGTAVALFYLVFFLIAAATYIREIEDFMCTQIYEKTPGGVIRFMAIFLVVYGVRLGLETLGRAAQLFFPLFAVFLIGLLLLLTPDVRMERLYPIMNTPVPDMLHTLMYGVFYPFGELCVFLMVYPYAQKNSKTSRDIFIALIIGALGLNLILFFSLTVLGVYASEHQFYAAYILAQKINIANSLQRIEALMATTWIISTYFKTAIYYFALTLGTAQLFKLKSHRPLILPAGFLLFGMSQLIAKDIIFYVKEIPTYWVDWDFTCAFVLPLMLLIVYYLKKRHAAKV